MSHALFVAMMAVSNCWMEIGYPGWDSYGFCEMGGIYYTAILVLDFCAWFGDWYDTLYGLWFLGNANTRLQWRNG
jgi:hypothetical protein